MKRVLLAAALATSVALVCFAADDFWNKKQPSDWSSLEVDKLLNDSPWAKKAKVTVESRGQREERRGDTTTQGGGYPSGGGGYPGGGGGYPGGTPGGYPGGGYPGGGYPGGGYPGGGYPGGGYPGGGYPGGGYPGGRGGGYPGGGGRGGRGGGGGSSPGFAAPTVIVRWDSASPVKQALEKSPEADLCAIDAETAKRYHVICAVGFGTATQRWNRDENSDNEKPSDNQNTNDSASEHLRQTLMETTSLHGSDLKSIFPEKVNVVQKGNTRAFLFLFPRDGRIEDNKDLEFESQVYGMKIKAEFKPKEMKYHGKLEM